MSISLLAQQLRRRMLDHGPPSPLRVAVVGAGSIAREFATRHLGPRTGSVVSCVVDLDPCRAQALAADVGGVQAGVPVVGESAYRSRPAASGGRPVPHYAALDDPALAGCDCVYIGTPPSSHAALTCRALDAGKHVILEKPLAASAADADAIVASAEEALRTRGLHTSVDIGMRWNFALHRMRSELEGGRLGPLVSGALRLHFAKWPREWQEQAWCGGRAEGGPLREVGTHFLFAVHELFGHGCVRRARATLQYADGLAGSLSESTVDGALEIVGGPILSDGAALELAVSVRTDGEACGPGGDDLYELEVCGERGALRLLDFTRLEDGLGCVLVKDSSYGRRECISSLVAAARGQSPGASAEMVTARQARSAQRVLDAMLASGGEWRPLSYE